MDSQLISIHYSDPLWITIAFLSGLAIRAVGLPPMLGFLGAGFVLNALGAESSDFLTAIADLGITLLLFSIGLKLKLKSLAKPEIWGVASLHMLLSILIGSGFIFLLSVCSLPLLGDLNWGGILVVGFEAAGNFRKGVHQ